MNCGKWISLYYIFMKQTINNCELWKMDIYDHIWNKLRIIVDYIDKTISGYNFQSHRVKLLHTKYIYNKTIYQKK